MDQARTIEVPSESRPGTSYVVTLHPSGKADCSCPSRIHRPGKACKHITAVLEAERAETWTLQFSAAGDGPPLAVRIRRLLKAALRGYGLKCIGYGPNGENAK